MTRRITTKSERLVARYQLCNQVTRQPPHALSAVALCSSRRPPRYNADSTKRLLELEARRLEVAGDVIEIGVFRNRDD